MSFLRRNPPRCLCQYHYFQPICPGHRGRLKDLETFEGLKQLRSYTTNGVAVRCLYAGFTFNFTQTACKQLGVDFLKEGRIDCSNLTYPRRNNFLNLLYWHVAIFDGYA